MTLLAEDPLKTICAKDAFAIARCSRDQFNKWRERGLPRTDYLQTRKGVASRFTYENVMEIAFLAALMALYMEH